MAAAADVVNGLVGARRRCEGAAGVAGRCTIGLADKLGEDAGVQIRVFAPVLVDAVAVLAARNWSPKAG